MVTAGLGWGNTPESIARPGVALEPSWAGAASPAWPGCMMLVPNPGGADSVMPLGLSSSFFWMIRASGL